MPTTYYVMHTLFFAYNSLPNHNILFNKIQKHQVFLITISYVLGVVDIQHFVMSPSMQRT